MGAEKNIAVFQCMQCGELHEVNMIYDIENDIYIKMRCQNCRSDTQHLYCGNKYDKYIYYDLNSDYRYYQYKTK
jgi:transcription elongation factor Elf1